MASLAGLNRLFTAWTETVYHARIVSAKTATVKLFCGTYDVDPMLAGRRVELVFDPFDLATVEVRWNGKPAGLATPQQIRRHTHPKARPETPATPPPSTGIDYLGIIAAEHDAAQRRRINCQALADGEDS